MNPRIAVAVGVLAFAAPAFAVDGAAVWGANCAKCHGETGKADTPVSKALKVPVIAGNAEVAAMSKADVLAKFKANPKHATVKVSAEELDAAAGHVKELAAHK